MPLTGGVPHWGTGEYNVKVTVTEQCEVAPKVRKEWKRDYRQMRKAQKQSSIWPSLKEFCVQNGTTLIRCSMETASKTAIGQWDWINSGSTNASHGNGSAPSSGMPNGKP